MVTTLFANNDDPIIALDGVSETTPSQYLDDFFGGMFSIDNRGYDVLALCIFVIVFQALFFVGLAFVRHEKR